MRKTNDNQSRILRFIINKGETSKMQIAQELNLSMPTVLQILKNLSEEGIVKEVGVYESTGGRKAKAISVIENLRYSAGLDITKGHIGLVLVDIKGQVVRNVRKRLPFENSIEYCQLVANEIQDFITDSGVEKDKILGMGVSLPGIVDNENKVLLKSHVLNMQNSSLRDLQKAIGYPTYFENDANAALMAEKTDENDSVVYLSLSNSVGGAICINGQMFKGDFMKAGEIGHVILHPNGKKCYCGKKGCVDAYLSPLVLKTDDDMTLDDFMNALKKGDVKCLELWDEYLDELALTISNIRMVFDTDIILGGYVGHYMQDFIVQLGIKISKLNIFDSDVSYIRSCVYKNEVSAVGAAIHFIDEFIEEY